MLVLETIARELGLARNTVRKDLRLCHSRRFYIRAYPRETQDMVFDAHARSLAALGGVPRARVGKSRGREA